ncbi:hypothetical protein TNCV_3358031 [Trichonephila clavipes]|nr:hypothetical protein TNCV_3358031 [Trichonephila clavipes]
MGEWKGSNMEIDNLRHSVVPISKHLVNDMLICSPDYEGLIEISQLVCNPAIQRKKELLIQQIQNQFAAKKWLPIYALRLTHSLYRMFQTKIWLK